MGKCVLLLPTGSVPLAVPTQRGQFAADSETILGLKSTKCEAHCFVEATERGREAVWYQI